MLLRERVLNAAYYSAIMALGFGLTNWFAGKGFLLEVVDLYALTYLAIGLLWGMKVGAEWRDS